MTGNPAPEPLPDFSAIRAAIATLPRVKLIARPTPVTEVPNLARTLSGGRPGPRIFIKRDDLTSLGLGGNKLRNLEFRLARTMAESPDTVIVGLDLQSNSARQTVAACNRLGLKTVLVLEGRKPNVIQGNLLMDYLLGAEVHFAATRQEQRDMLDALAARVRAVGGRPHILNDNPMFDVASAVAYLETTLETLEQLDGEEGVRPACFYMSSSGKGSAGLVLAQRLTGLGFRVHAVTATDEFHLPSRTAGIANETAAALGLDLHITEEEIVNYDNFVGKGYGIPSPEAVEAVKLFARTEGVILDPVYTGKAAAGLVAHVREGRFGPDDVLVFVHTGGTPANFTWSDLWLDAHSPAARS